VRFYTLPPDGVDWPWLFTTMTRYKVLFKRRFEHAIIDSGVEQFFNHGRLKDYPEWYLREYKRRARYLSQIFGDRVWVVVPDYPDDYRPGQTYESGLDNVDKTVARIEEFTAIDGVEWLPVIQSRYEDTFSFIESCHRVRELLGRYPRLAIGTVCKARKLKWIVWCCLYARQTFPGSWLHAFGLTLSALPRLKGRLDSFDSMVWSYHQLRPYDLEHKSWRTRAVIDSFDSTAWKGPRRAGLPSAKSLEAKRRYFMAYVARVREILGVEDWP